jgi:hypothetical protein
MPLRPLHEIGKPKKADTTLPWVSSGILQTRPPNCRQCRWGYKTSGFVPTFIGSDPKLALVFTSPDSEEVNEQKALESTRGRRFIHTFLEPYGLTRENLVVSYVLACLAPWDKKTRARSYPSGTMRQNAEAVCSRYARLHGKDGDLVTGGVLGWNPDLFVFSFDPDDCIRIPAYTRLIQRCIEKALHFSNCGYRPCVLLGEEAVMLQFPQLKNVGGLKNFLGHYLEQPFRLAPDKEYEVKKSAFIKGK